jgi:hypothetical protein
MTSLIFILLIISLIGLTIVSIYHYIKSKNVRSLLIHLFLIIACGAVLSWFFFPQSTVIPKGTGPDNTYFIIALYLFLLLGMFANYGFSYLSQPSKKRKKFDLGYFMAPILVSPIVFLPFLAAFQNANIEVETLSSAKLMFFCVAFENGFFWKEFFDNRQKEKEGVQDEKN